MKKIKKRMVKKKKNLKLMKLIIKFNEING